MEGDLLRDLLFERDRFTADFVLYKEILAEFPVRLKVGFFRGGLNGEREVGGATIIAERGVLLKGRRRKDPVLRIQSPRREPPRLCESLRGPLRFIR
ncbi:g842 [Coccomyxa elongata]